METIDLSPTIRIRIASQSRSVPCKIRCDPLILYLSCHVQGATEPMVYATDFWFAGSTCSTGYIATRSLRMPASQCSAVTCETYGAYSYGRQCYNTILRNDFPSGWIGERNWDSPNCPASPASALFRIEMVDNPSRCLPYQHNPTKGMKLSCTASGAFQQDFYNDLACTNRWLDPIVGKVGCENGPFWSLAPNGSREPQCPVSSSAPSPTPSPCTPTSLSALTAQSSSVGNTWLVTNTISFCLSSSTQVFISGDSTTSGSISVDDQIMYQLDSNPVQGVSAGSACATSGFLSGTPQTVHPNYVAPAIALGTLSAGSHSLKIGAYDCGPPGFNGAVRLVGCGLSTCQLPSPTSPPPSPSPTTASPSYQNCCTPCFNGFWCPTLNGIGSCSVINNGCTCGATGQACPTSQASCLTQCPLATTAKTTTPSTIPPSSGSGIWSGTYTINAGCSPSQCCCLSGTASVVQSGTSLTINSALSGQCGGQTTASIPVTLSSSSSTIASFTFGGQSFTASKNGASVTVTNNDANFCSASATCVSGNCLSSTTSNPSNPCFHKDTVITYAGKDHTFDEIRAHPECSIPHIVHTHGVIVTAKCGATKKSLRLTDGHLLYTQRGLQAAGDLRPGQDTVYADISEKEECRIMSITKETRKHDYFGLNCLNSQVLASGLKASTFEKLHSVPAFWMSVMGRILGIKRASAVGDYIADIVQHMNLI